MKKTILTSVALMAFAAASYAQVVNQQGNQQFAEQNQFGANQNGTINQVQAANNPNRTNYGNYAITFQGTAGSTGANTLVINQNDGSQGNRAGIGQVGGSGNNATINQNGGPDGVSGGASTTPATIGAAGQDGNFAGISQIGAANAAVINQNNNSRRNTTETYQNGNNNTANTSQSNNAVGNTAFIYQGFVGQGLIGTAVSNAQAQIIQGKTAFDERIYANSTVIPETIGNTASITQLVNEARASINQGGGSVGRAVNLDARITQLGREEKYYYGQDPVAVIQQGTNSAEAVNSTASITQSGRGQNGAIYQGIGAQYIISSSASARQSTASIVQQAAFDLSGNNAWIHQGIANGKAESDQASITQTAESAGNVWGEINQGVGSGYLNGSSKRDKATITQSGKRIHASIIQNSALSDGEDNTATITQGAGVVGDVYYTTGSAAIFQGDGSDFGGYVLQTNRNAATINQVTGAGFKAKIRQGGVGSDFLDASLATFRLYSLTGTLVALTGSVTGPLSSVANDNTASITQTSGNNHNANIYQNGLFNSATVNQSNGDGHQALIIQTSNSERAMAAINQSSSGSGNFATILQFTGANADGAGQYGNMATINQIAGSNNTVFIQQGVQGSSTISNDNLINVTQNGSNNFARFLQVGNNNVLNLTQNGSNNQVLNLAGDPNSYASQQGNNNQLTLTQNGSNLIFRYTQIGNNNVQVVEQTP
jgi:hypothetical protein